VYILLALLSIIAFVAAERKADRISGSAAAAMILLKPYYGLLIVGLLLWSRRPRAALVAVGLSVLVIGLTLPILAPAWSHFFEALTALNTVAWICVPANQTLNSFWHHLFSFSAEWNPAPLIDLPWLADGLRYGSTFVLIAVTLIRSRSRDWLWLWFPALNLMPILAPIGEVHHETLFLLPIAVIVASLSFSGDSFEKPRRVETLLMVSGLLLLIVPWLSLTGIAPWGGWRGLLAYPRLGGALLLWLAFMIANPKTGSENHLTREKGTSTMHDTLGKRTPNMEITIKQKAETA
jgi:hypothetical protein